MALLRFVVLSVVLFAAASAYTVELRDVDVYSASLRAPTVSGVRHYNAPADSKVGGPDDFDTLPYRYGFRLENHWDAINSIPVVTGGIIPNAQFYRLCPLVPEGETDDFVLRVQLAGTTCADGCDSRFSLALFNSLGLVAGGNLFEDTGCSYLTFNVKASKALTSDGNLWIRVGTSDNGLDVDYALHFSKDGVLNWDGQSCQYPAAAPDVFSPCVRSFNNIFDCSNGIFEPALEQCDLAIATRGCTGECLCEIPYKSDNEGGCTPCGNGLLELPFGEICDPGLDVHCDSTCTACVQGYVLTPSGNCSQCGNGVHESGEACDAALSSLCDAETCTCTVGCVGDGNGGCTLCGNGVVDPGEYCDAADPSCNGDCTACARGLVARPRDDDTKTGRCTLCGNGVVDAGEVCDSTDFNCNDACSGCTRFHSANAKGVCSRCGNGLLDKGEVCDSFRPGCKADCSGCSSGTVAQTNALGECSTCGNGALDDDEVCDPAFDPLSCASDCTSCFYPFVSINRRCVTCGNGIRDRLVVGGKAEVCDAAQPGCRNDCSGCEDGYVPAKDSTGSCIAMCENCCAALPKETTTTTSSAAGGLVFCFSASLAYFLVALLF